MANYGRIPRDKIVDITTEITKFLDILYFIDIIITYISIAIILTKIDNKKINIYEKRDR